MYCRRSIGFVFACSMTLISIPPCDGVVRTWDGGGDGVSWEDNCNWSGDPMTCGFQPFDADDAIIPAGTTPFPRITFVEGIARLEVQANTGIDLNGALGVRVGPVTNHGMITIADDGMLQVDAGGTLEGNGQVVLADSTGTNAAINGTATHGATHTIRGEGTISGHWVNQGLIRAEETTGDSSATLLITNGTMVNHGVVRSSPTSPLLLSGLIFTNDPAGQLITDTQPIIIGSASAITGTLSAVNGGRYVHAGTSAVTLSSVTINADFDVVVTNGAIIGSGSGITNNGVMTIDNLGVASGDLVMQSGAALGGTGQVILNRDHDGTRIAGGSFTHGASHTIRGVGRITAALTNEGSIFAEPKIGTLLRFSGNVTNNHLIQANTNATMRYVFGSSLTQSNAGRLRAANGGIVELQTVTVTGGRLQTDGTGVILATADARLTDVTNEGTLHVPTNNRLRVAGSSLTNHGTITVNPSGTTALLPTGLSFETNLTLDGTGTIVLNQTGSSGRMDFVNSSTTVTQNSGHTIRGKGVIIGGNFVNHGRLEGFSSAEPMNFLTVLSGDGMLKDVRIGGDFFQVFHVLGDVGTTAVVPVEGIYDFGRNSSLVVDLGGTTPGTGYDQLNSTGPITLSSTLTRLEVSIINGFVPSVGDMFTVVTTTGARTGTLGTAVLPTSIPNYALTWAPVQYTARDVILSVLTVTPRPGDFDGNGLYECADVDALVGEIVAANNLPLFDITGDGLVNISDLTLWLAEAGEANLPSGNPYLYGDANLDGAVDGTDFGVWNSRKFTSIAAWCSGDFNADGFVDGSDFGFWNANKFTSSGGSGSAGAPLPEPNTGILRIVFPLAFRAFNRKKYRANRPLFE
jgi:hypothetical protein